MCIVFFNDRLVIDVDAKLSPKEGKAKSNDAKLSPKENKTNFNEIKVTCDKLYFISIFINYYNTIDSR